ncbi:MAG: ABC transporter substrate-binding protein [Bacteroidota bacterium]
MSTAQQQHWITGFLLGSIALVFTTLQGCKQPETITAQETQQAYQQDTTQQRAPSEDATFQALTIGELYPIRILDPLQAQHAAELRMVQLVFEGLTQLDPAGEIIPALAKRWEINQDSTQYTFHLKTNIFYHDSPIFINGTGRRFIADDVRYIFHRMADPSVPGTAARLFQHIDGFDAYYQEQRHLYLEANRRVKSIQGITTPNDSTVVFRLKEADPAFLKKLATPYASVYPRETVTIWQSIAQGAELSTYQTAGTGPFEFTRLEADTLWTFTEFNNYHTRNTDIKLDRIDVRIYDDERPLFNDLLKGDVQLVPELGPSMVETVSASKDSLSSSYNDQLTFYPYSQHRSLQLMYHEGAQSASLRSSIALVERLRNAPIQQLPFTTLLPVGDWAEASETTDDELPALTMVDSGSVIYGAYTLDPFGTFLYQNIKQQAQQMDTEFAMLELVIPVDKTTFSIHNQNTVLATFDLSETTAPQQPLVKFDIQPIMVARNSISNLFPGTNSWWFDLRTVTVSESLAGE